MTHMYVLSAGIGPWGPECIGVHRSEKGARARAKEIRTTWGGEWTQEETDCFVDVWRCRDIDLVLERMPLCE